MDGVRSLLHNITFAYAKMRNIFYVRIAPKAYYLFRQRQKEFEDTKGVMRIRILKKDRQHNDQKTNNDLQNIHIKLKIE